MLLLTDQSLRPLVSPTLQSSQVKFLFRFCVLYLQQYGIFSPFFHFKFEENSFTVLARLITFIDLFAGKVAFCFDFNFHFQVTTDVPFFEKDYCCMSEIILKFRLVYPKTRLIMSAKMSLKNSELPDVFGFLPILDQIRTTYQDFTSHTFLVAVQDCVRKSFRPCI